MPKQRPLHMKLLRSWWCSQTSPFSNWAQYEDIRPFTVPLLTDSLNRMHRSYGVALTPPSATAVTFLIDPLRVLRFHIAQDLALWNLDNLHGLLRTKRHV